MKNLKKILFVLTLLSFLTSCVNGDQKMQKKNNDTIIQIDTTEQSNNTKSVKKNESFFVEPVKNYKNDSIINQTDLKIDLLFKQTGKSKAKLIFQVFNLYNIKTICFGGKINDYDLCCLFSTKEVSLILTKKGVLLTTEETCCVQELNIDFAFGVNKETYEAKYSMRENIEDYCVNYRFKRDYGEVYIKNGISQCGDTGHNPIKIIRNGKKLEFPYLRSILMFEYDIDQDGKKEIYLFDYGCCVNELTIYKIYGYCNLSRPVETRN